MKKHDSVIEKTKIYLITNCFGDSSKLYIGKTINSREADHKKIYGQDIEYSYIDEVQSLNREDWKPLECFWIEYYKFLGFTVLNHNKGGSGPNFHTEVTKQKMRKPKPNSGGKGKPKPGTSKALKGKYRPDTRERFKNKKFSEEHIVNLKLGHLIKNKDFYKSKKWLFKLMKPIFQYDLDGRFIKEYESIRHASKELNVNESGISNCLLKNQKTSYGYIWKYKEN